MKKKILATITLSVLLSAAIHPQTEFKNNGGAYSELNVTYNIEDAEKAYAEGYIAIGDMGFYTEDKNLTYNHVTSSKVIYDIYNKMSCILPEYNRHDLAAIASSLRDNGLPALESDTFVAFNCKGPSTMKVLPYSKDNPDGMGLIEAYEGIYTNETLFERLKLYGIVLDEEFLSQFYK